MRSGIFHLAIPAYDLAEMEHFYSEVLSCKVARRYDDRITLDFFGDQVVCHLTERPAETGVLELYPRHFGVTFRDSAEFDALHRHCVESEAPMFKDLFERFGGQPEVHRSFVLADPSDNLIEFKHYADPGMMY